MTNEKIREKLTYLVTTERRITNEILDLICLAMERRSFLEFGFPNIFKWLTEGMGYSAGAAHRRIEAARMVRAVPEVKEKLMAGDLNLTTVSKVQTAIRAQNRVSKVSTEERAQALAAVEHKSVPEVEKALVTLFPALKSTVHQEKHLTVDENTTRCSLNLPNEAMENLKRAKEVLSHKFPHAADADIIAYALEFLLDKKDPLRQPTVSAAEPTSLAKRARAVMQKHKGECSYRDPRTGVKCKSRYQIQIDHIKPRALGGTNAPENLRPLCRQHNLLEASRILGPSLMRPYWRRP